MVAVKISSKVDESTWEELREWARESNRSISGVLEEAISEYLQRRRVRPEVLAHLERSMTEHDDLGHALAE